ncbi:MAG: S8/S53 family peptidase [Oscillospiraceae bacterium]|nr:S8/S53 family peptidase [Oscillospiraceae bacterium]
MKKVIVLFIVLSFAVLFVACNSENRNIEMPEEAPKTVRIAVIDTGFSSKAIPAENILSGKNYFYPELSTEDTYGHGTAVASIILRYSPKAFLVPLVSNVFEDNKIRQVDNEVFAQMITDAVDIYDCDIINISAGLILDKEEVRKACAYAEENGVLVVASVGNDYDVNGKVMYYPAGYETVLAVGALDKDGREIAYFSQRGEWVDVFAVGEEVTIGTLSGNTRTSSGSSYSAAKVAAFAANIISQNPEIELEKLKEKTIEEIKQSEIYYNITNE